MKHAKIAEGMLVSYNLLDLIYPILFCSIFLVSLPFGRKIWTLIDCVATFAFGIGLILIPKIILGFQVADGKLDETHLFLIRQIGATLVGQAVSLFLNRRSVDGRMFGNVFYSRVFASTVLLIAQCYSAYHLWNQSGLRFNDKFIQFSCTGVFFWLLGSLIQLIRYREIGGYSQKTNYITLGFIIDHFILLLLSILLFALPTQILKIMIKEKTIDGVHACFTRAVAALVIGHALTSNASAGFLYRRDQRSHVIGRLVTQVLTFANNILGHFVTDLFSLYHVTPFMLTGFYITFLLTVFFRFNNTATVSRPEFKLKPTSMTAATVSHMYSARLDHHSAAEQREDSLDDIDRDDDEEIDNRLVSMQRRSETFDRAPATAGMDKSKSD